MLLYVTHPENKKECGKNHGLLLVCTNLFSLKIKCTIKSTIKGIPSYIISIRYIEIISQE